MAGHYVLLWSPTLLLHGGIEACQRYLVSQSALWRAPSPTWFECAVLLAGCCLCHVSATLRAVCLESAGRL